MHATSACCCVQQLLRRLQTYQLCKICCVPALAMAAARRDYQNYKTWDTYGTDAWWARVFEDPTLAGELVAQRLHTGGLVCPAETTSADVAAGIIVLTHGMSASTISATECDQTFQAFKVRRMRMRASHHTSYIKHLHCGGNRDCGFCSRVNVHLRKLFCVHVRPIIMTGAHQAACRRHKQGRRLHPHPPSFTSRLAPRLPACSSQAF